MSQNASILSYSGGIDIANELKQKIVFEETMPVRDSLIHGYYKNLAIVSFRWPSRMYYIYKLCKNGRYKLAGTLQDIMMNNCRNYEIYKYLDDGKVEFLYSEIYSLTENTTEIIKDNKIVRKLHQLFK